MALFSGLLLALAPTLVFMLDQLGLSFPGDPLVWAIIIAIGGLGLIAYSQREQWQRLVIALIAGVVGVALQFYLIAIYVLNQASML